MLLVIKQQIYISLQSGGNLIFSKINTVKVCIVARYGLFMVRHLHLYNIKH